ncbi:MAG TPA: cyclic nucleotide-binding domain-containing protein [Spirochaetota bacterium]|nr:cyclic nucleotide-binding domain-containing protein [Spirochaetota bacterium]HOM39067.1 cyclic nucleotide-binding domain-containing protein [Spirochaetota bacterium]HPQ49973.1 cyclic nucleotide-binding domain-containing protein [Spirochaetota bacterium]
MPGTKSNIRIFWDFLVFIITIYLAIVIPLQIVFNIRSDYYVINSIIISVIFLVDIFVNFFVPEYKSNEKPYKKYLRFWFWLDILTVIPFELFEIVIKEISILRIIRVLRLARLFKLYKIKYSISFIKSKNIFNPAILRMIILGFWMFLILHFISCGWIVVGKYDSNLTNSENYLRAFYWALTTVSTIGYGDITPSNNVQIIFTICVQLVGVGMYGFIIGNISSLLANVDIARRQFQEKLDKINIFLKYRNIPYRLQEKINEYYSYLWQTRKGYDEISVLEDLPLPIKIELSTFLHKEIIEKVPIFKGANQSIIRRIILNLIPVVFTPGDYIVVEGEIGNEMFFISKGEVEVIVKGQRITTLRDGQFFGEIALLLSVPRTASVRAITFCDMYMLDRETFNNIIKQFPSFEKSIQILAEERSKELDKIHKSMWDKG